MFLKSLHSNTGADLCCLYFYELACIGLGNAFAGILCFQRERENHNGSRKYYPFLHLPRLYMYRYTTAVPFIVSFSVDVLHLNSLPFPG